MRGALLALLGMLLPLSGAAQQRGSLAGAWELGVEPQEGPPTYDRRIEVPAAFETVLGASFDGVAWYRRRLPVGSPERGARVRLEFSAVATHATVRCNGIEVGQHLGGWTPFSVEVTSALRWDGNDTIEVRVDERVGHNTQGFLPVIQPHFGGIWQDVTLCIDRGPRLDRQGLLLFGRAGGELLAQIPTVGDREPLAVEVTVLDGARALASARAAVEAGAAAALTLAVETPRPWSPQAPHLYGARVRLLAADGRELDRLEQRVGFRDLRAEGTTVRWNGAPLQVRGVLHWGYAPPFLAPPSDPAFWRRQLEDFKSLGFNLLKCCLWVPPRVVYELCDELGLLVWQEYPTWHARIDQEHRAELRREYEELFAHDRSHPSVAFRSLTCETGHGADLAVIEELFAACHAAVPDTLVVDDSSWIGWQRITDFWDEHPYGNNSWWPGRLADFQQHQRDKGRKPLLLGECIAADTWADRAAWLAQHGEAAHWWRPDCFADQARFEAWIVKEFGAPTLASLGPISRDYALRNRRYQIEELRATIPDAGYVVSVARDFGKARMGLYDDFDRLKHPAADWVWHRDVMTCLDTPQDRRAFVAGREPLPLRVRLANAGRAPVSLAALGLPQVEVAPGAVSAPIEVAGPTTPVSAPTAFTLRVGGAAWDLWLLPALGDPPSGSVRIAEQLDIETLTFLEQGGRVLLRVEGQERSLRSQALWWLRGAPFAPSHPVHNALPPEMLVQLQAFDLDGGRVMHWRGLLDQVDPILAFWETHDLAEVRAHLLAFDCNVGAGRLLASCLGRNSDAGRYVEHQLLAHLAQGPAPKRSLTQATVAKLRSLLTAQRLDLPEWRFVKDPDDQGRAAQWQRPETDASSWRTLRAGAHWEGQADDLAQFTGIGWYRVEFEVPAAWQGRDARVVFEGIDDSAMVWLNGEQVGRFGDPAIKHTVWLERSVAELGQRLRAGEPNVLVARVVDHAGAGGLWKPVFVTTGPGNAEDELLQ